jgi:transglutaminase-like putative cysteine protease
MILEFTNRIIRRFMTPAFFVFFLLFGVVGSLAFGLSEIINGLAFQSILTVAFISLLFGWTLAKSRIPAWLAAVLVTAIGMTGMVVWVGNLLTPTVNILRTVVFWIWGNLRQQQEIIENLTPLQLAASEISFASLQFLHNLQEWSRSLASGNPIPIISITLLVWGLAVWIVSAWAGWIQKRRDNVFLSLIPSSLLLVAAMGYTWAEITPLIPHLFCLFLLLALTWINKNENHWVTSNIDYPVDARIDSLIWAVSITLILLISAYFVPRISIRKMVETIQKITNPQVQQAQPFIESFGIQSSKPSIGRFGPLLSGGLPRAHLIGSGPELSEQVVMTIQISGGLPPKQEANEYIPIYWRGLTYDQYTGSGWNSSEVSLRIYEPDETVGVLDRPGYLIVEQNVRFSRESELLFVAGDLITVDERFRAVWRSEPVVSDIEPITGDIFGADTEDRSYSAKAYLPVVDETTLKESSFLYPDWIRQNYILIPTITSQRVVNLTLSLIEDVHNPYDRAKIIEKYLRQFEYTTDLPIPPVDVDIADYFLFDLRKGYCDYFATAMVVMARAAYLPARLVVGYSRGTYDVANDRYVVTEADAHSWPEIYFDGVGWVPFEPTSARAEIVHPELQIEFSEESDFIIEVDSLSRGFEPLFGSWPITSAILTFVFVWIWMVWITLDEWHLKRQTPDEMASRVFWRLYQYGRRLGVPADKESTPIEFAESLKDQVVSLPIKSLAKIPMTHLSLGIEQLTQLYLVAQYSPKSLEDQDKSNILATWQRLRRQLFLACSLFWVRKLNAKRSTDIVQNSME